VEEQLILDLAVGSWIAQIGIQSLLNVQAR
jgi:hypothetical protein